MDLGFETCGNATLIVYDGGVPVLVTEGGTILRIMGTDVPIPAGAVTGV